MDVLEHLKAWRLKLLDLVDEAERRGSQAKARELWGRIHATEACIHQVQEKGGVL